MKKLVRSLSAVLCLGFGVPAAAQDVAVPQVLVDVKIVVLSSTNPSAGGARFGPSFAAQPGDELTTQLLIDPGQHGVTIYGISCQFDTDLGNELDIISIANLNGSTGPAFVQESDGAQEGIIETIGGSFGPPLQPFDPDTPIAEIVFGVNQVVDDGPDVQCGLFAAPFDLLTDVNDVALLPDLVEFPGTNIFEQRQDWAPTFAGRAGDYQLNMDIGPDPKSIKVKTGTTCKNDCPDKERGVIMKAGSTNGSPFPQGFIQPPVQVNSLAVTMTTSVQLDVSGLEAPGSFTGYEIDSPFVPVGGNFNNFVFFTVVREANGDLSLFSDEFIGGGPLVPIASPMPLPGSAETIVLDFAWANDELHMMAGPLNGPFTDTVSAHPFVFNGSAGVGLGMRGVEKGEQLGATIEISGDIAMATGRKMALDDLKAVIDLELEASKDLDAADSSPKKWEAAKKKLQRAIEKLKLGDKVVPVTKPPTFENPLITKAYMEAQSAGGDKVGKDVMKRLQKAAKRDEMAIKRIDKALDRIAKNKSLSKLDKDKQTAKKFIDKGRDEKVKTKAVLETLAKKDAKGV